MMQILQDLRNGKTILCECPQPSEKRGHLLIASRVSLVSAGTERMIINFSKANIIEKARQQPEKFKQVLRKIKTDGLFPTLETVNARMAEQQPLGYSNVGIVIGVGEDVIGFKNGDRVLSNGRHAEIICVPKNLCVKIPDNVEDEVACFTVIGSIGLQGIRLATPTLGETFVVTGLGLIGLMVTQLLINNGCKVIGIDFNEKRLEIANSFGANVINLSNCENPISAAINLNGGREIDGVIITAATKSNEPISQAAKMCRKRGRIILVGVTGLNLNRSEFYEKELIFQVSCSYGPGRYDPEYEEKGKDYPIGFVRWTEQRNFQAILSLMEKKKITTKRLITHRFHFHEAKRAYELLSIGKNSIGILLQYPKENSLPDSSSQSKLIQISPSKKIEGLLIAAVIGAGSYAGKVMIPNLRRTGIRLKYLASKGGVKAGTLASRYNFEFATTDIQKIFNDSEVNVVFIATNHDSHAELAISAIEYGKNIFIEKPFAIDQDQLERIILSIRHKDNPPHLMVGFNRRFSSLVQKAKSLLTMVESPKAINIMVNAGEIPESHWTQNLEKGGGRLIGEGCHFIDLIRFLADSPFESAVSTWIGSESISSDKVIINARFQNGSIGTIQYLANGHKSFPKERIEIFCGGRILQIDNFKVLRGWGWKKFKCMKLSRQDKGQRQCLYNYINFLNKGGISPIPIEEIIEISRVTIELAKNGHIGKN